MGAGDWVTGGVRRAVSGVAALLPGAGPQDRDDPDPAPGTQPSGAAAEPSAAPEAAADDAAEAAQPAASGQVQPTKAAPRRAAPAKAAPAKAAPATAAAPRAAPAKKAKVAPAKAAAEQPAAPVPAEPPVTPAPIWSAEEVEGFRAALDAEIARLREELDMGEADLADLVADSGDGSGDDQADAGSKTFEREHEMSVNANTRELIDQALRARARLDAGTYGICERCGTPIAIGRLRAYPRATLCIRCKQAEERR